MNVLRCLFTTNTFSVYNTGLCFYRDSSNLIYFRTSFGDAEAATRLERYGGVNLRDSFFKRTSVFRIRFKLELIAAYATPSDLPKNLFIKKVFTRLHCMLNNYEIFIMKLTLKIVIIRNDFKI